MYIFMSYVYIYIYITYTCIPSWFDFLNSPMKTTIIPITKFRTCIYYIHIPILCHSTDFLWLNQSKFLDDLPTIQIPSWENHQDEGFGPDEALGALGAFAIGITTPTIGYLRNSTILWGLGHSSKIWGASLALLDEFI